MQLPVVTSVDTPLPGLLDVPRAELAAWLADQNEPAWRADGLRRWILDRGVTSFAQMTDLPKSLRMQLQQSFHPLRASVIRHLRSIDETHKLLLRWPDDKVIECVLIQEDGRRTACISTQVGCGMGCVFCASGINGVERNLTVGEIVEQLVRLRELPGPGATEATSLERLTHIVVMGMGEPLANLDALLEALELASSKQGMGIGARHITISTVGLPAKIRQLAEVGKQYHLAVSLHAPNDALRNQIIPTNDKIGLDAILAAADYFYDKTGRQVTYEYVLLHGLNDLVSHGRELAHRLKGRQAHVNLIPFNDVEGLPFHRPTPEAVVSFSAPLKQAGISVKVRKRKGADIDAACGQLRKRFLQHG